jgi:hypothetical protein
VTQLVLTLLLPLHEVAAHPAAAEPLHAAADPATAESAADLAIGAATLTKASCLCVRV